MSPWWRRGRRAERVEEPAYSDATVVDDEVVADEVVEEEIVERRPPRIWPWLLALLLLVLGGLGAYWLLTRDDDRTTVPRLVGLTESEARVRLADADLDADFDRRPSRRAAGRVFAQTPGAGKQLEEGERVEVLVSTGPADVAVPGVVLVPERQAVARIEAARLRARVERVFAGAAAGTVVDQDPRGGIKVARGSTVVLKVSKGRNLARIPDVVGETEAEAVRALRAREFDITVVRVPAAEPRGIVISQNPPAGERAPPDSRVRINVSRGTTDTATAPATTGQGATTAAPARATVPRVVSLDEATATRRLRNAGFRVEVVAEPTDDPAQEGIVLDQQPAPRARVRPGSMVTIFVGTSS